MLKIKIKYNDALVDTDIRNRWNDITLSDMVFLVQHFFNNTGRLYETVRVDGKPEEVRLKDERLFRVIIAGITLKLWNIKPWLLKEITGEELDNLVEVARPWEFIIKSNELTNNLVKRFFYWKGLRYYYGPLDDFKTMDCEEYVYCDTQFTKYRKTPTEENLNLFTAILMRKARKDKHTGIDKREVFNPQRVEERLKMAASMPYEYKYALMLWYEGCRNKCVKNYWRFFEGNGSSGGEATTMMNVMMAMSKDIFGTFDQVKRVPIKVMMARTEQLLKETAKTEE